LRAGKLGLPELVEKAKGKRSLHDARVYIAECLKACQSTDILTVTQAAQLMQVNRDNILSFINSGRLRATNTSRGYRPRYRIAKADLDAMGKAKEIGKKTRKSKSTIPDYFPDL
jgi:excisionase family DNA binding protein